MSIQEEINKKTVALVISASKMTGRVLQAAIREYLRQQQKNKNKGYQGKQTIKQLVESGAALSNIEITNKNIKSFEPVAKKYGLDADLRNVCLLKTKMIQFIYRMIFHGNPPFPRCFHSIFLIIIPFPISF